VASVIEGIGAAIDGLNLARSKRQDAELMREALAGTALAVATCVLLALLPLEWARGAVSNLLTLIGAIYVGFALTSKGRLNVFKQIAGCVFFVAFALLGLWMSWWFLVAGLALHGVWDYLHRGKHGHGVVPKWYVPFCALYDWVVAIFVAVFFAIGS
jgi:hypothetical protein